MMIVNIYAFVFSKTPRHLGSAGGGNESGGVGVLKGKAFT